MYTSSSTRPTHWPQTTFTRAFIIAAIVQAVVVTVLESYVLAKWQAFLRPSAVQVPDSRLIPTFLVILVFAAVYSLAFIQDGLRRRSAIQVAVACVLNVALLVNSAIQPGKIHTSIASMSGSRDALDQPLVHLEKDIWAEVRVVLVLLPCLVAVFTLLMVGLAWKIHGEFEWEVYRFIAGDPSMKRRFLAYQIYILLLKVYFFFIIGWIAQLAAQVLVIGGVEFIATLCAVPVITAVGIMSHFWTKRENRPGTVFTIMHLAGLGYFIYKLVVIYTWEEVRYMYEAGWTMLNFFAGASIALLFLTVVNSIVCLCNFGKGLKVYLIPNEKEEDSLVSYEPSMLAYNPPAARRLSLD
ncbi:hypothetical protein LZ554_008690 [Drepanopeziza brunnea f. sp. 'monogermtubi']|nr:hypothetical protein LZ554_008690 [Drepanopeziza brunnea f. sp. 'monogermtubi']